MSELTIEPASYRHGHSVLRCVSDGSGFKTKAMWAVEKLGGKWVHRYKGYVMPTAKAERAFKIVQRLLRFKATP